jgi:ankyrin repeat protein
MNKIKLLTCLNLCFNIFTAETNKQTISPINNALNAIQNRTNTPAHAIDLTNCINEHIAGGPLLHHAIFQGKINWVESLLRQKADVNKLSTSPSMSPLEIAASVSLFTANSSRFSQSDLNRFKIIKLLIENGADPRRPDISDFLPKSINANPQFNKAIQQTRALTISRIAALNKCDEFVSYVKAAKLKLHEIRALSLYQIYAEHNPSLKAYLEKLEQQEKENIRQKRPKAELPTTKPIKKQCTEILIKKEKQD